MTPAPFNRREFLRRSACASMAFFTFPALADALTAAFPQTNILFLFTDDHAVQAISAYGSVINKTPNIDRIAARGCVFENSFCANSICAPSRANVLTGKHSHANGLRDNRDTFDGAQVTFPKLLQAAGYQTALIGKWHLKSDPTGFDHWQILPGQGNYYNPDFITAAGRKREAGYCTDIITDKSIDWLRSRDKSRPFLLMSQHKAPHRNWSPPPKYLTLYDDRDIPEPPTLFDDYANRSPVLKHNEMEIARHMTMDYDLKVPGTDWKDALGRDLENQEYKRMTPEQKAAWDAAYGPKNKAFLDNPPKGKDLVRWKYQRYIKDYLRCIASVDENVGRILDELEATGDINNTLVVYSSDQGFYLGEHGWYDKRWMFEESFRMPLLMCWPGVIAPNTRAQQLVQNIDYAPTFLDAAGLTPPLEMHGDTMRTLFADKNPDWRDTLYYHYYEEGEHNVAPHDGVRTERYKLIHFYGEEDWDLIDLEKDPLELRDVWDDPAYADIRAMMLRRYYALRKQYDAPPLPIPGKSPALTPAPTPSAKG